MDDIKIIIWIVIGLVYLFSRRKKKPVAPESSGPAVGDQEYDSPAPKAVSFEDLLREIQGMKKPASELPANPTNFDQPEKKEWQPDPYQGPGTDRKQLEDANYDYRNEDKIYEVYENATRQTFNRPSLEEIIKLEDTIVRFSQFKEYESTGKRSLVEEYVKELKDPNGFKKAFIMSEILNRRF